MECQNDTTGLGANGAPACERWSRAQAAADHGVADRVLISTDKAVRQTNVMGTSMRVAEMLLKSLTAQGCATRYVMTISEATQPIIQAGAMAREDKVLFAISQCD